MLVSQKQLCDEMISEKEKLIDELQEDLKQKDDQYVKDLRKQVNYLNHNDLFMIKIAIEGRRPSLLFFIKILLK